MNTNTSSIHGRQPEKMSESQKGDFKYHHHLQKGKKDDEEDGYRQVARTIM